MYNLVGSLAFFSSLVNGNEDCDRPVRIQLMQVQDGTASFTEDVTYMNEFMINVIDGLKEKFGTVEVGLASYTDKPQYVTGAGPNGGVWKNYTYTEVDYCYHLDREMSVEAPDYSKVITGGGKDVLENQFDALYKAVIDPKANWEESVIDEDGKIVIKLAFLLTDGPGHRKTEYDMADENRNWYYEELMLGPCNYNDNSCKSWHGTSASRTGVALSLEGVLSHYNHFKKGNDAEMLTSSEYYGWKHQELFDEWRFCCKFYNEFPPVLATHCTNFWGWKQCAEASCKDCANNKCDPYCEEDPEFEADWIKEVEPEHIDVTPYQYGIDVFKQDCATMEYPDPFSQEYADGFARYGVTPLIFIRKPAKKAEVLFKEYPFGIEDTFLANNGCPVTGQRLMRYWLCYSDTSKQRAEGITQYGGCDGYDPAELRPETFYEDCFAEHYGKALEAMENNGVDGPSYIIVESDVQKQQLLDQLETSIVKAIEQHPRCRGTTAEPIPVPVVTTKSEPSTSNGTTVASDSTTEDAADTTSSSSTTGSSEDGTNEGSSAGVIVGAAAGGVAGLVAVGSGLFAKLGFPGWSSTVTDTHIEDANLIQTAEEREQMTEVSANMFL